MSIAREQFPKQDRREAGFVRRVFTSFIIYTQKAKWSPFFFLLIIATIATFALEILKSGVSEYWYFFLFIIAVANAVLEALKQLDHGK